MAVIGIIENGAWVPMDDGARHHAHEIDTVSNLDQIVSHLAAVVRLAQRLSAEDQRRVRDFVRASLATLEATTSLPKSDQKRFERALRG